MADVTGAHTGTESSISNWAGPYVTDMLGRGKAVASQPFQAYQGPLTAGTSNLQNKAFEGIGSLSAPVTGAFDANAAANYMNPYLTAALQPQLAEMRRQSQISGLEDTSRLTKAGAYGGTRQAVMDAERDRALQSNIGQAVGTGYAKAFDKASDLFDRDRGYGLDALAMQGKAGEAERAITQEGIAADKAAFEEERDFPYRQVQYMQSLLEGMPVGTSSYSHAMPSSFSSIAGAGGILDLLKGIFQQPTSGGGGGGANPGGGAAEAYDAAGNPTYGGT